VWAPVGVWGVGGGVCGVGVWGLNEQSRPLLTFDIPLTALVATLDTYDFLDLKFFKNLKKIIFDREKNFQKSKNKNQKSKIKIFKNKSKIKNQKSKINNQKIKIKNQIISKIFLYIPKYPASMFWTF
jgi:hypothetical protein